MKDYGRLENIQEKLNKMRQESKDPNFTQYLNQMQTVLDKQYASAVYLEREIDQKYKQYLQLFPASQTKTEPQPVQPVPNVPVQQAVLQQPLPAWAYPPAPQKKSSMEFKIGADIFSVIGILFILSAFVMLGINYMGDLFKGLSFYVVSGALILISELILRRRAEKLSFAITGLGICGLYGATIINCVFWENFNNITAAAVTVGISVFAVLISRKKDSGILKIISFLGGYIVLWPAGGQGGDLEFAVLTAVFLGINAVSLLMPVKKHEMGVLVTHLVMNTLFSLLYGCRAWFFSTNKILVCLFFLCNILLSGFLFLRMEKGVQKRQKMGIPCSKTDYAVLYGIMLFIQSSAFALGTMAVAAWEKDILGISAEIWRHIGMGAYLIPALLLFLCFAKSNLKWIQYYAAVLTAFVSYAVLGNGTERVVCVLSIFIISKLLSGIKALRVGDVVITSVTAVFSLFYLGSSNWYGAAFALAFLLSVLTLRYYKVFQQMIITFVVMVFISCKLWEIALLPAIMTGVLFLFLFLFNQVRIWRDKHRKVYNVYNLIIMGLWCLIALYVQDFLNSGIMVLLGTGVIVLMFCRRYEMEWKEKNLFLVMFWTYMTFTAGCRMIVVSSILMGIAILSVMIGFAFKQKGVRVYGLVLSVLVSLKILFYDFSTVPMEERMLLFFVVGVIILAISCIYIILEKKIENRGEKL